MGFIDMLPSISINENPKFKAFQGCKKKLLLKKTTIIEPFEIKPCLINLRNIEFVKPKMICKKKFVTK